MDAKDPTDRGMILAKSKPRLRSSVPWNPPPKSGRRNLAFARAMLVVDFGVRRSETLGSMAPFFSLGIGFDVSAIASERSMRSLSDVKIEISNSAKLISGT